MRFGAHLRGTRPFWTQRRSELTSMITQLQCATLFFTLSVVDTKWPDLHAVMQENIPSNLASLQQWCNRNIIDMPHIVAAYMHKTFSFFREEMLKKKCTQHITGTSMNYIIFLTLSSKHVHIVHLHSPYTFYFTDMNGNLVDLHIYMDSCGLMVLRTLKH